MTEQELEDALRARSWRVSRPATSCLDEADLAAFVDGGPAGRARERVVEHLADCESCVSIAANLLRLRGAEVVDVPPDLRRQALQLLPARHEVRWRNQWRVALTAAGLILAVGTWLWHEGSLEPARLGQEAPAAEETNSLRMYTNGVEPHRLLTPDDGATVDPGRLDLRWTAVRQGLFYEVQVLSEEGDLVWEGRTEAVEMRLPGDAGLDPGREYFVWVRAYLPDGKTLKSPVVGFHVAQGEPGVAPGEGR